MRDRRQCLGGSTGFCRFLLQKLRGRFRLSDPGRYHSASEGRHSSDIYPRNVELFDLLHALIGVSNVGGDSHKRFYEKVIKVKADVAALLNFLSDISIDVR